MPRPHEHRLRTAAQRLGRAHGRLDAEPCVRRSSPSPRHLVPSDRRRRRAGASAGAAPRAPPPQRRTRRGRDARRSALRRRLRFQRDRHRAAAAAAPCDRASGGVRGVLRRRQRRRRARNGDAGDQGGRSRSPDGCRSSGARSPSRSPLPVGETTVRVENVDRRGRRVGTFGAARPRASVGGAAALSRRPASTRVWPGRCDGLAQSVPGDERDLRAEPHHRRRRILERARLLAGGLDPQAGDRGHRARADGREAAAGIDARHLLRRMLLSSDNAAANSLERYFGGSTSGGSALVNALMRSIGLVDTDMYGGYTIGTRTLAATPGIPARVEEQPYWGRGQAHHRARPRRARTCRLARRRRQGAAAASAPAVHSGRRALSDLPAGRACSEAARSLARCIGCRVSSSRTRQAGSTAPATTPGSCSGAAVSSWSP